MLDGIERMRQRPIEDLIEAMRALGADAVCVNSNGCPPVIVRGGGFNGGSCRIKGTLSSQYLSAILMAAPFAKDGAKIEVEGDLVSKPYVDMTRSMMAQFGLSSEKDAYSTLHVRPATQESGSRNYSIEPDASGATYFLAAAAVLGSAVTIEGLGKNSLQGDAKFVEVLEKMGCIVEQSETQTSVTGSEHKLRALNYDFEAMPDTAQTAAALAIFADGTSTLTGLRTLRVKETDRIAAMKTELEKLGAIVAATDDSLTITPPKSLPADYSQPIGIETYDDHRMAMAMAVAGLKTPLIIQNAECVNKTFPTFWDLWIGNTKMQK
jgi:3-phosphoshikimate 1-carboxyvinyltransferase